MQSCQIDIPEPEAHASGSVGRVLRATSRHTSDAAVVAGKVMRTKEGVSSEVALGHEQDLPDPYLKPPA